MSGKPPSPSASPSASTFRFRSSRLSVWRGLLRAMLVALPMLPLGAVVQAQALTDANGPASSARPAGAGDAPSLESVLVTATRSPAEALNVPASASIVSRTELETRNAVRLGDALADVPGLYIRGAAMGTNFPGTGQAVLSLRGVPRTARTLVMIDGQPVNNSLTGGIDVGALPLAGIEQVEIVRGPYSALYGGSAMGGVINFITAAPERERTEIRLGAGSFNQRGATLVHRKRYENGLGVSLSMSYRESAGYPDSDLVAKAPPRAPVIDGVPVTGARPSRAPDGSERWLVGTQGVRPWVQDNAQLSLYYSPSASTDLVAGVGWGEYKVGYTRPRSFLRDAAGNAVFTGPVSVAAGGSAQGLSLVQTDWFTPTPSRERDRRAFARVSHRLAGGASLQGQIGILRHDFSFSQAGDRADYSSGSGVLMQQPNQRIDGELGIRAPMSASWLLSAGVSMNHSKLDRRDLELERWRDQGSTGALIAADGGRAHNWALYAQSEHDLGHDVRLYAGGRYDHFETDGYSQDVLTQPSPERYSKRSFHQFSPKLALVWQARPGVSLRTSWGRGFRPPALFDLYASPVVRLGPRTIATLAAPDLAPERITALEAGTDLSFGTGRQVSFTVYRQRLSDLIYRRTLASSTPIITRVQNENVAGANVDGIEASMQWPLPLAGWTLHASATHHFRYEVTSNRAVPEMVGKKLTDVPRTSWSAGVEYRKDAWTGMLMVRHVDHVFGSGDDLNLDRVQGVPESYDGYTVVSARIGWQIDRNWGVNLSLDNLTDRRYFVYVRQPGRSVYGELTYRF